MSLYEASILLFAAVVAVPLFQKLRLGSVLGYLAVGVLLGPSVLHVVHDAEHTLHVAEFGVVLLLFLIGLELQPSRLWEMRSDVFGWGGLQVAITTTALAALGLAAGLSPGTAAVAGFALSLSSTAFALQVLAEKNELTAPHGQKAFGILLFQDMAAIPALALIPLLGGRLGEGMDTMAAVRSVGIALAAIALVVFVGRYLVRYVFRWVMGSRVRELSSACALLLVVGTALAMTKVGLSPALGAFLAGVLLADSEYRHELEADVEPFKGLLMGLFFMAVGMNANLDVIVRQPGVVVLATVGLIAVKGAVLFGLANRCGLNRTSGLSLAIAISQGGEFAFVLFGVARTSSVMTPELHDLLVVVVTASMIATPLLFLLRDAWLRRTARVASQPFDDIRSHDPQVIIAGFGRYGQIVGRVLRTRHIRFTALDVNSEDITFLRKFGNQVFYGDASRVDLLRAAGADKAKVLVVAVDQQEASLQIVRVARANFPHLRIMARARNRPHAFELLAEGVEDHVRETLGSSLETAESLLQHLGMPGSDARETIRRFREFDEQAVRDAYTHRGNMEELVARGQRVNAMLAQLFDEDAQRDES
jgi:glutathione-regulated potassium-efflux system ancillary protein KefC